MLAYDFYYRNKDKHGNVTRSLVESPIKKIYVEQDTIKIDSKTREEYGSKISERYRILQESLIMPLDTSDRMRLNLPDNSSTSQPHPYIKIYGTLTKSKSKSGLLLKLSIRTKTTDSENLMEAEYDLMSDKRSIKAERDIPLRIDSQNYYFISNENREEKVNVFKKYVESGILTEDSLFSKELFVRIADKFCQFTKESGLEMEKDGSLPFSIYLLPSDSEIEYHNKKETSSKKTRKRIKIVLLIPLEIPLQDILLIPL